MPNTLKYRINSKKSLCKSKKEKKCKKIKGCKMARGPKKTFCRKIKNKKYGKTKKKRGGRMRLDTALDALNKTPLGKQVNERFNAKTQELLSTEIPIDENTLKVILNKLTKLDEKKIEAFIKDEELKKIFLSGDKNAIIGVIMQNKQLRSLVMKEMMNNSELRGLIFKLAKGSMRGGNLTEDQLESLERAYERATPSQLQEIMSDESKEGKERSIAQKLLFEKLKF